ncbi:RHS repeat-associated core domain-containing protein [Pasteurella sp. PK-2025]|uniref:RHS repeat-associated core domain-containing protein n=1 Tax=Pasteurella sp. PK-2025 TaxID=3413133 RepID=UPI003C73CEA5
MWYYQYDALGRRISKACPQQQLRITYLWDGDQLAYTQTVKQNKLTSQRHSVFNGWQLIAQQDRYQQSQQTLDGNKTEWKHETHYAITQPNGKVLGLLSPEGKLKWKDEKRSVWGLLFPNDYRKTSPLDPQLLFAGQYTDPESGLAYNRFRYYDPESGNYISSDPIGLSGGATPYNYVSNPWLYIDPYGLKPNPILFSEWINKGGSGYSNYISDVYTGITNNFDRRVREHAGTKGQLRKLPLTGKLTRNQARSVEQAIIHHRELNGIKGKNAINSISPKRAIYDDAIAWGEDWIRKNDPKLAQQLGIKKC